VRIFFDLLAEAPVSDIKVLGNWDRSHSFKRPADRALVAGEGRATAITKAWRKASHDFKLVFVNAVGGRDLLETGIPGQRELEKLANMGVRIEPEEEKITVIFTNNSGDQWRPMTPWIMAHRFGHAVNAAARRDQDSYITQNWQELEQLVFEALDQLADLHGVQAPAPRSRNAPDRYGYQNQFAKQQQQDKKRQIMAHAYGTMRSARTRKIARNYEFHYELFAQYLLTGKVSLENPTGKVLTHHVYGKPVYAYGAGHDKFAVQEITGRFARDYEVVAGNVLDACNGKLLVM
jgi:hypothetical protein